MSRKLPLVGGNGTGSNAGARRAASRPDGTTTVTTLWVDQVATIAVLGTHATARAEVFVDHLVAALAARERPHVIERSAELRPGARLVVIVGSHVPRALRDPAVQAFWERADLLLADPSAIVADALAAVL